jgi:1-acyl-sn-glycerol-3-phosphate acyltransferase
MRKIYQFFFLLRGWKIKGDVPRKINKYLIVVAPHSSNWDFLMGLAVRSILKFSSNYLGKKELFNSPIGWFFRMTGGRPVDRSKSSHLVDQVSELYKKEKQFVLALAPEGSRKKSDRWKSGFYYIAVKAEIPIVMCGIDYSTKTITFAPPFSPSGNFEKDAVIMWDFFKNMKGKNRGVNPVLPVNK